MSRVNLSVLLTSEQNRKSFSLSLKICYLFYPQQFEKEMDLEEYRMYGKAMVDYIADYLSNIRRRRVFPDVKPGYMRSLLPDSAPESGESFEDILGDVEKIVMPGITHWQSPQMHAYFPALNSPASLLGDMLADGLGCLAFTWASSPACTELEIIVMDWLAKLIGLPEIFLHSSNGKGGGVIQTTASESTFIGLLAARTQMFQHYQEENGQISEADLNTRLVAYTSDQAHSSVEKAGLIGLVKMRYLESDSDLSMRGDALIAAIRRDREKGLIPFFVCATLGTTGACAFDNLKEIGVICEEENLWLHIDAAYAGSAFVCPEFRHWLDGIEYADSFAFNPSKWLMVHFDCTAMWVKNSESLHRTFNVDPLYLKHENTGLAVDFTHWQISLSKRFRALKLWFVLRNYGIKGLQEHIRHGVEMAKEFEKLVREDDHFEIPAKRHLGLVVFRVKGENELTENLLKKINSSGRLHCVPSSLKGKYVIRFTVTSPQTTLSDIHNDWGFIQIMCSHILNESPSGRRPRTMAEIKKRNPSFGTSLLLSNSPMTPKIMNGSFVAIFEPNEVINEFLERNGTLDIACKDSPVLQRRLKGLVRGTRQFSLDSHIDLMVAAHSKSERKSVTSIEEQSLGEDSEDKSSSEDVSRCDKCGQVISL
ncbi:histidine decarboxylase [Caerostris darwini]|uniref:Histidine decarboxylase n=1 Tax=Caerostris darwini TaxID=1538125 RepID=A0AAV4SLN3_9ARAC|nr:histidine decarboxylase [Caerostris darwini]